jgi:cytochrome c biogenesis protein CcdA
MDTRARKIDRKLLIRVALFTAALVIPFAGLALLLHVAIKRSRKARQYLGPRLVTNADGVFSRSR